MTPEAAFKMQIERYREMAPSQRIELALRFHEIHRLRKRYGGDYTGSSDVGQRSQWAVTFGNFGPAGERSH